jgi:mono/diheme cytochrome c family protein
VKLYAFDEPDLQERVVVDAQYGEKPRYRGVPLTRVLERYGIPEGCDLALLHFHNGMVIPLPLGSATLDRVDVFIAHSIWLRDGETTAWSKSFPDITKRGTGVRDRRPIRFNGNKVVVENPWHPMVANKNGASFSPWLHADSLSGIELAQSQAYYRQFQAAGHPVAQAGYVLFVARCQFCHGARSVGASFGWDFVDPVPLYTYRGPKNLFLHVRYREGDAPELGLMMPAFQDLTERDAEAVWSWLKAIADKPMAPYRP